MNWQEPLVTIYRYVCKHYQDKLWVYSQRMSHHANLSFTDGDGEIKSIYDHADRHLRPWFPRRLSRMADVFASLLETIQQEQVPASRADRFLSRGLDHTGTSF
jgi:hypothetical protein